MQREQRRLIDLLGDTLARLEPHLAEAAKVLDRKGQRALRNKITRGLHFALAIQRTAARELDEFDGHAPTWVLAEEIGKSPVLMGESGKARPSLQLVVDNTGDGHAA